MKAKELIDKTKKIIEEDDDKSSFNIFTILRKKHEEVRLHSRFICELLNPKGTHRMNQKYLSLFLEVIKDKAEIPLPNFSEEQLSTTVIHRERFNIDLLLYLPDGYTMIIENKINAGDQLAQLEKYFNTVVNERRRDKKKIFIVYLTLDGREPSEQSKGELEHDIIYPISYASEIDCWLEMCGSESDKYPNLYETITQYKRLVCQLSGKVDYEDSGMTNKVADLILTDKESLKSAIHINKALNIAKARIVCSLLDSMESEMAKADYIAFYKDDYKDSYEEIISANGIDIIYSLKQFLDNLLFCFGFGARNDLLYYFFFADNEGGVFEGDIKKKHPKIYKKCFNAISEAYSDEDIIGEGSTLIFKYILAPNGEEYEFQKKFTDSFIELSVNIDGEAKRICGELIPIVKKVKSLL